jgi:nucleotide-binding universal stress UspA family protein
MASIAKICVGIDDSPDVDGLLDAAAGLAGAFGARVWLVTVIEPLRLYQRIVTPVQSRLRTTDEIAAKAAGRLEELASTRRFAGVEVDHQVQVGVPFADLIAAARTVRADLLVVGAKQRSGMERLLLGGTAERVLRKSPIPVLVVKPPLVAPAKVILAPTDFSDASLPALRRAAQWARQWGARLVCVHAVEPLAQTYVWPAHAAPVDLFVAEPEEIEPEWTALLAGLDLEGIDVAHRTVKGYAASSIVRAAAEGSADLIVMGTHGRSGLMHMLLGSVAEKVAREAPCSILTVRPEGSRFSLS